MASLALGVRFLPVAAGTADFVYSSTIAGYRAATVLTNSKTYRYRAESADLSEWEFGTGIWSSATNTLTRNTVSFSSTGSKVSFTLAPQVSITINPDDVLSFDDVQTFTTAQKIQARANMRVSTMSLSIAAIGSHSGGMSANGSGTYTTPTGCTAIRIRMVGGGSGGSGGGTSGAGSSAAATASTWSGGSLSAGGGPGVAQSSGGTASGVATGGNIFNINGEGSGGPNNSLNANSPNGANSFFGGAGRGVLGAIAGGNAAANSGSGGGGGGVSVANGGSCGGTCGAYVEHFISSPAATYTYVVGAKSVGGTAGTSGAAGGDGADGYIVVEEYYD
jgi:hypothetical protein